MATVTEQYKTRFGSYPPSMTELQNEGYIDSSVADPFKAGYTFSYTSTGVTYTFNGGPTDPGESGYRYFYVDPTGVVRFSTTGAASSSSSALGQGS